MAGQEGRYAFANKGRRQKKAVVLGGLAELLMLLLGVLLKPKRSRTLYTQAVQGILEIMYFCTESFQIGAFKPWPGLRCYWSAESDKSQ